MPHRWPANPALTDRFPKPATAAKGTQLPVAMIHFAKQIQPPCLGSKAQAIKPPIQ